MIACANCGATLTIMQTHHRDTGSIYCDPDSPGIYDMAVPATSDTGLDWDAIPDDHPGWDALIDGIRSVSRIHRPGHDCETCRKLSA